MDEKDTSNNISTKVNSENYLPQLQSNIFNQLWDKTKISYILLFGIVVFVYVVIFVLFGNSSGGNGMFTMLLEIILWVVLIIVIGVNVQHMDYDFSTELKNLFNGKTKTLDVKVKGAKDKHCKSDENGEVFHIPNNKYTYTESRDICKKYDARLATYTEIEDSYKKGANWCSYGWSEDQLALFPTQKEIYKDLKLIPGHEHDCGRPGINGGFIDNIHVKFGVNCFGKKPEITKEDEAYMERLKLSYSPAIDQEEFDKLSSEKKSLLISPFNKEKWTIL